MTMDTTTTRITRVVLLALVAASASNCALQRKRAPESQRPEAVEFYVRGEQARRAGDMATAEREYKAAVQRNPNLRMAHSRLGDMYKARGNYAAAGRHYEALARLDAYNPSSHYNVGLAYQFLNRLQDAAAAYLRALNLNPSDVKSNMNLGLVYLALGQVDDAVKYLERATELDPRLAVAQSNLGVALDARGDAGLAEQRYRRALELDSNSTTTLQNLAANLITQGKAREAVTVMEQVIRRTDTPATRKRYGDALAQSRRYDEAVQQYDAALKSDPRYWPAMNEKGYALIRQYREGLELDDAKRQGAIALWRNSLKLNNNQPTIRTQLDKAENPQLFGTGNGE
jgi:Tfp pilus assembly protein PilF